jgi:hypothetical protein
MGQIIRKISTATVYGGRKDVLKKTLTDEAEIHDLYHVYGRARMIERGKSKFDATGDEEERESDWKAFIGQFEAINLDTGEVFNSGKCFLPDFAANLVAGQFTGEVSNVEFAFTVQAKSDDSSATGYVYSVRPLIEGADAGEQLADLRAAISAQNPKAIGKPKE